MQVEDILKSKEIGGAETIPSFETLATLSQRLSDKRIGAMVVVDADGRLCGVISERDVVRALATDGPSAVDNRVERYMTREVETATRRDGAVSVLERMTVGRFRHMPVIDNGGLVGVISIGDLVKARIDALQRENADMEAFIRS